MSELQAEGLGPRQPASPRACRAPGEARAPRRSAMPAHFTDEKKRPGTCRSWPAAEARRGWYLPGGKAHALGKCPEAGTAGGTVSLSKNVSSPHPTRPGVITEGPPTARDEDRGLGTARSPAQGLHVEGDVKGTPSCVLGTHARCPQLPQLWQLGRRKGWEKGALAPPSVRALRRAGGGWALGATATAVPPQEQAP